MFSFNIPLQLCPVLVQLKCQEGCLQLTLS